MLEIKGLTKRYGRKNALNNCNISFKPYEIVGVLGRNGCGKSTLFKSIMGLIQVTNGDLRYEGKTIDETQRHRFGYMPEQRSLLQDLSLDEHLRWVGKLKKMNEGYVEDRIHALAEQFDLSDKLTQAIRTLSKGQQQKAQLMIALLNNPTVLILDEPLNGLDMESVAFFTRQLKLLASQGKLILISSHQMEFMDELCTSFIVLQEGTVIKAGRLDQFKTESSVVVKLNSSCDWSQVRRLSPDVKDLGAMIQFSFSSIEDASKLLSKTKSIPNLHTLRLESTSIVDVLLDHT